MPNELLPFKFHNHTLSIILDEQGEPWFIAKEVAEILQYSEAHKMCKALDSDEKQNRQIGGFGPRGFITINESGIFMAIINSTKPEAKEFRKWITGEVLPSIRKTGRYGLVATGQNPLQTQLQTEQERSSKLTNQIIDLAGQNLALTHRMDLLIHDLTAGTTKKQEKLKPYDCF